MDRDWAAMLTFHFTPRPRQVAAVVMGSRWVAHLRVEYEKSRRLLAFTMGSPLSYRPQSRSRSTKLRPARLALISSSKYTGRLLLCLLHRALLVGAFAR